MNVLGGKLRWQYLRRKLREQQIETERQRQVDGKTEIESETEREERGRCADGMREAKDSDRHRHQGFAAQWQGLTCKHA